MVKCDQFWNIWNNRINVRRNKIAKTLIKRKHALTFRKQLSSTSADYHFTSDTKPSMPTLLSSAKQKKQKPKYISDALYSAASTKITVRYNVYEKKFPERSKTSLFDHLP